MREGMAYAVFLLMGVFWGYAFVVLKDLIHLISAETLMVLRFGLVTVCSLPLLFVAGENRCTRLFVWRGAVLGALLYAGMTLQTVGLRDISASESGLITTLYVTLIPLIMRLIWKQEISSVIWVGACMACVGLGLFQGEQFVHINQGTVLTILCAGCFAFHIVWVDRWTGQHPKSVIPLMVWQFVTASVLSWAGLWFQGGQATAVVRTLRNPSVLWPMMYLVVFCTLFAFAGQLTFQRFIHPVAAALLMASEMLFAGFFGYLAHGDAFSVIRYGGAVLFVLATFWIIYQQRAVKEMGPEPGVVGI